MSKERVAWVDKLKAVGILCVILGYILFGNDILYGNWYWNLVVSLILLQFVLSIKKIFINKGVFKYV